jgi:hypothetical protein
MSNIQESGDNSDTESLDMEEEGKNGKNVGTNMGIH